MLAVAAADAAVRIYQGQFYTNLFPLAVNDFLFAVGDGLGRDGTMFFADQAVGAFGVRDAAAAVDERGAQDLGLLFFQREVGDGAGGADLAAEVAGIGAITQAGDQQRRPQPF